MLAASVVRACACVRACVLPSVPARARAITSVLVLFASPLGARAAAARTCVRVCACACWCVRVCVCWWCVCAHVRARACCQA
eukprot:1595741-Alexandrium_andersonii.AAC.1